MITKCFDQHNVKDFPKSDWEKCIPVQLNISFSPENWNEERFSTWSKFESDVLFHLDCVDVEPDMKIILVDLETQRKFNINKEIRFLRKLAQMTREFNLDPRFLEDATRLIASDVASIRKERTGLKK